MSKPFVPAFGGKTLVPGCSDKTPRDLFLAEQERSSSPVKLTTASRASAALEHYWQQQQQSSGSHAGNISASSGSVHSPHASQTNDSQPGKLGSVPGGERELAHKTRDACWRDSVQLSHHAGSFLPDCEGVPQDIAEKEVIRTRGIPGYTGCQPPPGASKPPELPQPVEASRWTAINAFDERRPRVKGIPGYTGHQPHTTTGNPAGSPQASNAAAAAAAAQSSTQQYRAAAVQGSAAQQQHYSSQQLPVQQAHPQPQATHVQGKQMSSGSSSGDVQEPFLGGNPFASYAWKHCGQQQQQQASLRQPPAADADNTATAAGTAAAAAAAYAYPQTAGLGSVCASRISSPPLYFCNGVEVPSGQVPIPPHSAAGSSYAGVPLTGGCSRTAGCSMMGSAANAVSHTAEVMVVDQGGSVGQLPGTAAGAQGMWPVSDGAAAAGGHSYGGHSTGGHTSTGSQASAGHAGGQNGSAGGGVRVGRPAVGPWCTTYSTTFVQQEAFKGLMREFQEAALQRQQGR